MNEHQWKAVNQVAQRWKIVSFLAGLITIATYLHTWLHYGDWAIGGGGGGTDRAGLAQCSVRSPPVEIQPRVASWNGRLLRRRYDGDHPGSILRSKTKILSEISGKSPRQPARHPLHSCVHACLHGCTISTGCIRSSTGICKHDCLCGSARSRPE